MYVCVSSTNIVMATKVIFIIFSSFTRMNFSISNNPVTQIDQAIFYIKIGKHLQVAKWLQPATWLKNNKFSSLIPYNALNKFIMLQNGYPRIQMLTVEENLEALSNIFPSYIPTQYTHTDTHTHTLLFKV